MWLVFLFSVATASLISNYNTSQYVGRIIPTWRKGVSVGDWLGFSNGPAGPTQENKATFGVPGNVIDLFFATYEHNDNNASDCKAAYGAIGFSASDISRMATAYSNGDQFFTYMLLPAASVNANPATWANVISLASSLYASYNTTFNLTDVLTNHLPQFQAWCDSFRANSDPFPSLLASDLGNVSFNDLTSPPNPNFITSSVFFALSNPSAVATRAWLRVKFGLFPEFMGDGFTLPANHSAQGLGEVIFPNRQVQASDVMIPLICTGGGFVGLPGMMSVLIRAFDTFELYADGNYIANSTAGIFNDDEVVNLNTTTNLIGVRGRAFQADPGNGILMTIGNRAVTNASWYCKKGFDVSWTKFGFNFFNFPRAVTHPQGDSTDPDLVQQDARAQYIWTANPSDTEVYCTIALGSYSPAVISGASHIAASLFMLFPLGFVF